MDHIQVAIPVGGEMAARPFYIGLLGFSEIEKPEPLRERGGLWLQAGAAQLHLGVLADFVPATKAHPAFLVDSIDALRQRLVLNSVVIKEDSSLPSVPRFFVDDPFGNRLEFIQTGCGFNTPNSGGTS